MYGQRPAPSESNSDSSDGAAGEQLGSDDKGYEPARASERSVGRVTASA